MFSFGDLIMAKVGNQAGGNVAPFFSLHPGRTSKGVINFDSKTGWNHWKMATAQLQDEVYDCKPKGFYQFMESLNAVEVLLNKNFIKQFYGLISSYLFY